MRGLVLFAILPLFMGCQHNRQEAPAIKVDASVIYPKIRVWSSPSAGEVPDFNPPAFEWPSVKQATYGIRISTTKDFSEDLIQKEGIRYAIFNPHQALKSGKWYWQYKVNDGSWNPPDSFLITAGCQLFQTPGIEAMLQKVKGSGHPRILVGKADLASLRERAKQYGESARILIAADGLLEKSPPKETDALPTYSGKNEFENKKIALLASKWVGWHFYHTLDILSQAYILSGDPRYFVTAKRWMLEAAPWDPSGPTHTNNFGDSGIMAGLALGVDTFWDMLSEDERARIMRQSASRAEQFYRLWINQVESRSSSMHVWQHILHRMSYTSLALIGEVPEAERWFEYIYELWIAQAPKMGEQDGAWFNGTGYFSMNTLTMYDINFTLQELSGVDFMGSRWYKNNPRWLIYAFPPNSIADGFCNNGDRLTQPAINYAGFADAAARKFEDPYAAWYASEAASGLGLEIKDDHEFRWYRIQRGYQSPMPEPIQKFDLPQAAIFPDVGVAYMHTSLQNAKTNLMLSIRSSPYGPMAHTHADQNTFNIAYGGKRLFYNTGYRPAMGDPHFLGWYKHTQGHNGVLINGKGQPFVDGAYGWIPRFLDGNQLSYAVGDATNAYQGLEVTLKSFRRHFLMIRPSTIIIYDELEAEEPAEWTWLLHNDHGFSIQNNEVYASNSLAKAKVSIYSSSEIELSKTDQFSVPVDNWTNKVDEDGDTLTFENQWHFKAISKEKVEKMRFLAVFQIKPDGSFEPVRQRANTFEAGEWLIEAIMDTSFPAEIRVKKKDNTVAFSSKGPLDIDKKVPGNDQSDHARLYEWNDGEDLFVEASDSVPIAIQNVMGKKQAFRNYKLSDF